MALTKRYVRADADGTGDGTTDANSGATGALTIAQMITDLNTPHAGYKYLIKTGTYARTTSSISLSGDGTTTSPIVIEGFNTTEGDLYAQGRTTAGPLDTTNFPEITFTSGIFDATGAQFLVMNCLRITSAASNYTLSTTARFTGRRLAITNTGTNSASNCVSLASSDTSLIDCDLLSTAAGGTSCLRSTADDALINKCRIKCPAGNGILTRSRSLIIGNTIYECGANGIATDNISAATRVVNNTIVNCTSDGIELITGTTGSLLAINNHITGNGAWGIEFNTSTCMKILGRNRFRDNTSGEVNGGGDWEEGAGLDNITTDSDDPTEFVDSSTDDYRLSSAALAFGLGIGAGDGPASGSGGWGFRRRPRITGA